MNMPTATTSATRAGRMLTAVVSPSFAPSTKRSNTLTPRRSPNPTIPAMASGTIQTPTAVTAVSSRGARAAPPSRCPRATEPTDAIQVAGRMSSGAAEPACMRSIAVVAGMSWIEAVLTTTNIAISFVAAPSARCSLAISHIARMPSGVAALPRPRKFAMRFMVMAFTASPLGRRPLKRRFVTGASRRESIR